MHSPESHAVLNDLHPLGRIGSTADIVDALLYLSEAMFTTGAVLAVDPAPRNACWARTRS
jgi:NAD(P)-dependent dehydrogenase (short-subunit alcohol dehydrogenase family)